MTTPQREPRRPEVRMTQDTHRIPIEQIIREFGISLGAPGKGGIAFAIDLEAAVLEIVVTREVKT